MLTFIVYFSVSNKIFNIINSKNYISNRSTKNFEVVISIYIAKIIDKLKNFACCTKINKYLMKKMFTNKMLQIIMSVVKLLNYLRTNQCTGSQFQGVIEHERASSLDLSDLTFNQPVNENGVSCMALDPVENKFLITAGQNRNIKIYNVLNEEKDSKGGRVFESIASFGHRTKHQKYLHKSTVSSVQWYPHDTGMFFTSSYDETICSWDTNRMKRAEKMRVKKQVYNIHVRPTCSNQPLIAAATSSNVNLIDLFSANFTHQLTGHKEKVIAVRWSPTNEHLLASGSVDGQVLFWDVRRAGFPMKTLDKDTWIKSKSQKGRKRPHCGGFAHSGTVNSIRFTCDGRSLLTYGTDNTVRLWSTSTTELMPVNYGYNSNTFHSQTLCMDVHNGSQDDSLLFVPGNAHVSVYNLHDGNKIKSLRGSIGQVKCCTYNPTTQDLYVTGRGPKILVYSPTTYPNLPTVITSNFAENTSASDNVVGNLLQNNWSDSESDGQSDWL